MSGNEYMDIFLEESLENLQGMEEGLLKLEKMPESPELINEVFRAVHTVKGGAGLMGFEQISEISHYLENILDKYRSSGEAIPEEVITLLLSGTDLLRQLFDSKDFDGDYLKEQIDNFIQAFRSYEEHDDSIVDMEDKFIFSDFINEVDEGILRKAISEGNYIYRVHVWINKDCLLKSVRAYMVFKALDSNVKIISTTPLIKDLEEENFDLDFSILFLGDADLEELHRLIEDIAEIDMVNILPLDDDELENIFKLYKNKKSGEKPFSPKAALSTYKYFKIILKFKEDSLEMGIEPLMLLMDLKEKGNILESYLNMSKLPDLYNLNPERLYIFWTVFIETRKNKDELEEAFIFLGDNEEISVEEITEEFEFWFNGDKRTGELLVERGLISPEDIEVVLKKQKRIGELLVEEGKVTNGQIAKVVRMQQSFREKEQSSTIRVDTQKLESVLNYIAELLIAQSQVKELVLHTLEADRNNNVEAKNAFQEVDKIIRLLQEEVLHTTMIPIGGTFLRFQRMVRELAREKGKEIELVISGRETELDKKVIEQITDPLKHLIRNAVDHGLETPEERKSQGKPAAGTIELKAYHQEGNIVIEIKDDGRGIDEEAVLKKALEKGLVEPNQPPADSDIKRLIFSPGFSTAKAVSNISGRGVGLDVVMTNIQNLKGNIDLYSEKGRGTTFIVTLPLTLAIIDGMIVRVGEEHFIIPLNGINEFIKAGPGDIFQAEGKGLILHLREEYIPYAGLYQLFGLEAQYTEPTEGILVILKEGKKKLALLVDDIIGQEQVVIKSLKDSINQADGMAGATIMGDGKVAIILDVSSILKLAGTRQTVNG